MRRTLQTEAIVLDRREQGESDRRVVLLCATAGKLTVLARGARRSRKRFGGCLELFSRIEVTLSAGRGSWLALDEACLQDGREGLRRSLLAIAQAGYLSELTCKLLKEEDPSPEVFALLEDALRRLDHAPFRARDLRQFELDLLSCLGLAPNLQSCLGCGSTDSRSWKFDHDRGGILCSSCEPGPRSRVLESSTVEALRAMQAGKPVAPSLNALRQMRALLFRLLDEILGSPLNSREFLRNIASGRET